MFHRQTVARLSLYLQYCLLYGYGIYFNLKLHQDVFIQLPSQCPTDLHPKIIFRFLKSILNLKIHYGKDLMQVFFFLSKWNCITILTVHVYVCVCFQMFRTGKGPQNCAINTSIWLMLRKINVWLWSQPQSLAYHQRSLLGREQKRVTWLTSMMSLLLSSRSWGKCMLWETAVLMQVGVVIIYI